MTLLSCSVVRTEAQRDVSSKKNKTRFNDDNVQTQGARRHGQDKAICTTMSHQWQEDTGWHICSGKGN